MPTTAFHAESLTFRPTIPSHWISNSQQNSPQFYNFSAGNSSSSSSSQSESSSSSSCNENSNSPLRSPDTTTFEEFSGHDRPYLQIIEQPHDKFRFRYKTEMQGTHGAILGTQSQKSRSKTFPKVKLCNYRGRPGENNPIIRCTLYTGDDDETKRKAHVHRLVGKSTGEERDDPHDEEVRAPSYTAHFQQMTILFTKKEEQLDVLIEKKQYHMRRKFTDNNLQSRTFPMPLDELKAKTIEELERINLNVACLRFEALLDNGQGKFISLCQPIYSRIISNMKNPQTNELKICRVDQCMGSCDGGQEVFMFVEKVVKKNIKVKFFEEDENGITQWSAYADFSPDDVHHQFGIVFKTPPYRDPYIKENVTVNYQLERPSDNAVSEPRKYEYTPNTNRIRDMSRKRARHDSMSSYPTTLLELQQANSRVPVNPNSRVPVNPNSRVPVNPINRVPVNPINRVPLNPIYQEPTTSFPVETANMNDNMDNFPIDIDFPIDEYLHSLFPSGELDISENQENFSITSTPSFTQLLSDIPSASSEVLSNFFNSDRFEDYLLANNEVTSSNDDRERIVVDGCSGKPTVRTCTTATRQCALSPHERIVRTEGIAQSTNKTSHSSRYDDERVRRFRKENLTEDNIVERVEHSLNILVQLWRARRIAENRLRMYISRLFQLNIKHSGDNVLHILAATESLPLPPQVLKFISILRIYDILEDVINFKNNRGETPLHKAALRGTLEMISLLMNAQANVNATDCQNNTALHLAVLREQGGFEVISTLLPFQPKLDTSNKDGFTALHLAVRQRKSDIVSCLCIKSDDDCNHYDVVNIPDMKQGNTPLHIAVYYRFKEVVNLLLNFDQVNVNAKNFAGKTPLAFVWKEADKDASEIKEKLLANKADPSLVDQNSDSKKEEYKEEVNPDSDDEAPLQVVEEEVDETLSAYAREWDDTELFDKMTISKLCPLLDENQDWKFLARRLKYKDSEIEYCANHWSSTLFMFKLAASYKPEVTSETVRDLLLDMSPRLHCGAVYIDEMMLAKAGI